MEVMMDKTNLKINVVDHTGKKVSELTLNEKI